MLHVDRLLQAPKGEAWGKGEAKERAVARVVDNGRGASIENGVEVGARAHRLIVARHATVGWTALSVIVGDNGVPNMGAACP